MELSFHSKDADDSNSQHHSLQEGYSYEERFVIVRDYEVTEDGC